MIQHHKWSLSDIENMIPFERQVYVLLIRQWLEEENKRIGDQKWTIRGTTTDPYLQLSGSYSNKSKYIKE